MYETPLSFMLRRSSLVECVTRNVFTMCRKKIYPSVCEENPRSKSEIKDLIDREEFSLRKRLPRKLPKRKNDVYVSRRTNFKQQLERCEKLLNNGSEVYIHGLGAAINRAVNLTLELKNSSVGNVETETHTSTVELVDDLEPETDEHEPETFMRNNSAVHIKVFKVSTVEPDKT